MALPTIANFMAYPTISSLASGAPTITTIGMTAVNDIVAAMCEAPKTGNITKIHYHLRGVTGASSGTITVSLQTITHSGVPAAPSGTLWGTSTSGTNTVDPATDDNTTFSTTLTNAAAVTRGDRLAACIELTTVGGLTLCQVAGFGDEQALNYPYLLLFAAAAWTLQTSGPVIAFEYDDGTILIPPGCIWYSALNTSAVSSSTTPDTYSLRFKPPMPMSIGGGWVWADLDGAQTVRLVTADYNQGSGTGILATTTIANDDRGTTSGDIHFFQFPTNVDLDANVWYRLVFESTSGTSSTFYDVQVASAAQAGATKCGADFHLSTAKDPTANASWTNYDNGTDGYRWPWIGLLAAGFSAGIFLAAWGVSNDLTNVRMPLPEARVVNY